MWYVIVPLVILITALVILAELCGITDMAKQFTDWLDTREVRQRNAFWDDVPYAYRTLTPNNVHVITDLPRLRPCITCHASVGQFCTTADGKKTKYHEARKDDAA